MKKSLSHLPEHKRLELHEITNIIVKEAAPEMIILFESYARGTWVEDWSNDPEDLHTLVKQICGILSHSRWSRHRK